MRFKNLNNLNMENKPLFVKDSYNEISLSIENTGAKGCEICAAAR